MSVTFSIEGNPTGAFTATCYNEGNGEIVLGPVEGYPAIEAAIVAHKATCEECAAYGLYSASVWDVSDEFDVNLANVNARTLLAILGLDTSEDLCGMASGEDFLGRVLLALATDRDDSGVASAVVGGAPLGQRGATMIDCGLSAGYFGERFDALHALAQEAVRLGRPVVWS